MKELHQLFLGWILLCLTSCVHTEVNRQVDRAAAVEGDRYASEVAAQSPFEKIEMSWSEAEKVMEQRNQNYLKAEKSYVEAVADKPVISDLTQQFKETAKVSIGDVLKPSSVIQTLQQPATQIPKQLASLSKIKDFSHDLEQDAWQTTANAIDAEMKMREEQVKLQQLLRKGEILEREFNLVEKSEDLLEKKDPKITKAFEAWRKQLEGDKNKWLGQVRNLFDAEYFDVRFVKDTSGLPTYEKNSHPDLTDWPRWCYLRRTKQLIEALAKEHQKSKPTIPGTKLVKDKVTELTSRGNNPEATLETTAIRKEVRKLIQSWREMKAAQKKARQLEEQLPADNLTDLATINSRRTIYNLRNQEIQHASVVWLMDEHCWP